MSINGQNKNSNFYPKRAYIVVSDSIIVKTSNVGNIDYNYQNRLYVTVNEFSKDILIFNEKGKIVSMFNKFGEGPEEYKSNHSLYVYFFDSTTVIVLSNNIFKRYSFTGKYVGAIPLDNESKGLLRYNVNMYIDKNGDTNFIYRADQYTKYRIFTPEFYDDTSYRFFINYNLKTGKSKRVITYEDVSIYKNGDVYYPNVVPVGYVNKRKRLFDVLFPNDNYLYRYDLDNNFSLHSIVELKPDYFGKMPGLPFGKRPRNNFRYLQQNSSFQDLISVNDTIVTMYRKGLKEDETFSTIEEANENIDKFPYYLQVLINNKKISKDIKIPDGMLVLSYFHSLNKLLIKESPNEYDEMNNSVTFYICKIEFL
jgi:hypothetical protein